MKIRFVTLMEATCLSALAGGATVAAVYALMTFASGSFGAAWLAFVVSLAGVVAMFAFVVGTLVIGIPVFLLFDRLGWSSPTHAVLAGAALSALAVILPTGGDTWGLMLASLAAAGGGVAGLVFRRVAYSRD